VPRTVRDCKMLLLCLPFLPWQENADEAEIGAGKKA
jgi:hypothetical protein